MPPAYEILLLNTAIPQIQAAQSGDTYVVPRDIAFSTVASLAAGTESLPSLVATGDTNTGFWFPAADTIAASTGGTRRLTVDSSGNLGLGATPTANYGGLQVVGPTSANILSQLGIDAVRAGGRSSGNTAIVLDSSNTTYTNRMWYLYNSGAAGSLIIGRPNLDVLTFDNSGNLGLGVTPSAWNTSFKALQVSNSVLYNNGFADTFLGSNFYNDTSGTNKYISTAHAAAYGQVDGAHYWYTAPSGFGVGTAATSLTSTQNGNSYTIVTAGTTDFTLIGAANNNVGTTFTKSGGTGAGTGTVSQNISFTQVMTVSSDGTFRVKGNGTAGSTDAVQFSGSAPASAMTLDASGNWMLGTTGAAGRAHIVVPFSGSTATSLGDVSKSHIHLGDPGYNNQYCQITFGYDTTNAAAAIGYTSTSATGNTNGALVFATRGVTTSTLPTERARITSGGYFKASDTGTYQNVSAAYHELRQSASDWVGYFVNSNATPYGIQFGHITDANSTGSPFFQCTAGAALGTVRAEIRSNGGLANYQANDANLSDRREKTNFAPAKSYLDTICAIPVQTFNYIDQSEDDPGLTLGVVAQDVQAVAPELVSESNWGTEDEPKMRLSIYQTDLQYALMKAIQELKAQNDDLRARLAAAGI